MRIQGFYINLNRRTDRREQIEAECQKMGISIERFPAIEHWFGGLGCIQSHLQVLKLARERGYPAVTVLEDDFEFLVTKEEFEGMVSKIPQDFDMVMLGYNLMKPSHTYNDTFEKVVEAQTTSGYIIHNKFYNTLINVYEESSRLLANEMNKHGYAKNAADQCWKRLQPSSLWLNPVKRIGRQREGYSDIEGMVVNYGV